MSIVPPFFSTSLLASVDLLVEFFFFRFFTLFCRSSSESDEISSNDICSSTFSTSESELSVSDGHFVALMIDERRFFEMPRSSSKQISCNSSLDLF